MNIQKRDAIKNYLANVRQRLMVEGFRIQENVTFRGQFLQCVAKRTRFQLEYGGFAEIFFMFNEFSSLDTTSLREFSRKCFEYAMKSKSIPLPCGLFESIVCFAVALVDGIDATTAEAVQNEAPPKHRAAFEMVAIYDLRGRQLYYLEKTPIVGRVYYDHLRATIRSMLSP